MGTVKLADVGTLEEKLTDIADAIRSKTHSNETIDLNDMATEINENIYSLEDVVAHKFNNENLIFLGEACYPYQFSNSSKIISFTAPNLRGSSRAGTWDGGGVGTEILYNCANLERINIPVYSGIGSGGYHFARDVKLTHINAPFLTVTGQHMFESCTSLRTFVLNKFNHGRGGLNSYGFQYCTALKVCDVTRIIKFNTWEFNGCTNLDTLILRDNEVIALGALNNLNNTPFASGKAGGTLYVPQALIESYKTATNWTTLFGDERAEGYVNNQILPIEGSEYETVYADGTLLPTYIPVVYERDDGKVFRTDGTYGANTDYFSTAFINKDTDEDNKIYIFLSKNSDLTKTVIQEFKDDTFIGVGWSYYSGTMEYNGETYNVIQLYLPNEEANKFRFCMYTKANAENGAYLFKAKHWGELEVLG